METSTEAGMSKAKVAEAGMEEAWVSKAKAAKPWMEETWVGKAEAPKPWAEEGTSETAIPTAVTGGPVGRV